MNELTIGELARQGEVNVETIRFYERKGLLPKPPRTASGYRAFPIDSVRRVRFIKQAQEVGFTLKEIKDLLALRIDSNGSCADVLRCAEAKADEIDEKIRTLQTMRKALKRLIATCPSSDPTSNCPILESLEKVTPK